MPHRTLVDPKGRRWEVWEVHPTATERRLEPERRGIPRPDPDRRRRPEPRIRADPALAKGWLAFAWDGEKRRLAPIPDGWTEAPDPQLLTLLEQATPAGRVRRLIE